MVGSLFEALHVYYLVFFSFQSLQKLFLLLFSGSLWPNFTLLLHTSRKVSLTEKDKGKSPTQLFGVSTGLSKFPLLKPELIFFYRSRQFPVCERKRKGKKGALPLDEKHEPFHSKPRQTPNDSRCGVFFLFVFKLRLGVQSWRFFAGSRQRFQCE